jgi:hypothetical protein
MDLATCRRSQRDWRGGTRYAASPTIDIDPRFKVLIAKVLFIVLLVYVGFVALMEALIGYIQPHMDGGVRLTTTDAEGRTSKRMLAGARLDGKLYIASNHWLRGWYRQALAEPSVLAEVDGVQAVYTYRMGFVLRFICGFAPSRFLRLDPC